VWYKTTNFQSFEKGLRFCRQCHSRQRFLIARFCGIVLEPKKITIGAQFQVFFSIDQKFVVSPFKILPKFMGRSVCRRRFTIYPSSRAYSLIKELGRYRSHFDCSFERGTLMRQEVHAYCYCSGIAGWIAHTPFKYPGCSDGVGVGTHQHLTIRNFDLKIEGRPLLNVPTSGM
jgi:hypothetical protein